jgi:hypothetical protein
MTGIVENWAECHRCMAKPALEVAQGQIRESEQNKQYGIAERHYKKIRERTKTEQVKHAVACLDVRELSRIALHDILSEPAELMIEFSGERDYEEAMKNIEKDIAVDARTRLRHSWKETYYWPMIQRRAKMHGTLPKTPGPKTEITPEEKLAAKRLIVAMGHGTSRNSIFKWTSYLKLLSDLRDRGAVAFLLCRTSVFKTYFFQHSKDLDVMLCWNEVYEAPLERLRLRVIAQAGDDFSGQSDLENKSARDRLHGLQHMKWEDNFSAWRDLSERENFWADHKLNSTSGKSNISILRHNIKGELHRNKSIYIDLVPYEGESNRKTLSKKPASSELLAAAPLVLVAPGDFLGIFPGEVRYTCKKSTKSYRFTSCTSVARLFRAERKASQDQGRKVR